MNKSLKIFILVIIGYLLIFYFNDIRLDPIMGVGFLFACLFIFLPRILTANERNKNVNLGNWEIVRLDTPNNFSFIPIIAILYIGISGIINPYFINTEIEPNYPFFQADKIIYYQEFAKNHFYFGLIILAIGSIWENNQSKFGIIKFKDDSFQLEWNNKIIEEIYPVSEYDQIEIQATNIIFIKKNQSNSQIIIIPDLRLDDNKIEELKNWLDKKLDDQ